MEKHIIEKLLKEYPNLHGAIAINKFGSGHIHNTYKVEGKDGSFILQEFNDSVFKFPERISGNLQVLRDSHDPSSLPFQLPLPKINRHGESFTRVEEGLFRLFPFVKGVTRDAVGNPQACKIAAESFAHFVSAFMHVDASRLEDTIPDFHNLSLRFRQFEESLTNTRRDITEEVRDLIAFYQKQKDLLEDYNRYVQTLPLRVTHNDTKINNLIYEEDLSKVNALIDLDTIMAGYVFYDFGDLVRTVVCTEDESCQNWDAIAVDLSKYEALVRGFFIPLKDKLPPEEMASLTFGGEMMTCIMGLRFLTDYLNGNVYYNISYEEQNLHRSKNQSRLLQSLRDHRTQIQDMVNRVMES